MATQLPDVSRRFRALIESAGRVVHQRAAVILVAFSALYIAGTVGRASQKLLWHDELFTLHVSRLPLSSLWLALATPSDATPPLFHLVTRAFLSLPGDGLVTIRLSAILGFLLAMFCVYAFVARRYGPLYGLLAAVVPVATNAYVYAYEARAYGLVLGLTGVALVAWQRAAEGGRRPLWLVLLCLSEAAALASHYYAVLLLVPVAAGEAVRFWVRRRADWPLWAALVISLLPLLVLHPLIRSARTIAAGWFSIVEPRVVVDTYQEVLAPLVIPALVVFLGAGLAMAIGRRSQIVDEEQAGPGADSHEWVAMVVLATTPLWATSAAGWLIGSFVPRYALIWVLGFSVLSAFVAAAWSAQPRTTGVLAVLTLVAWTAAKQAGSVRLLFREPPTLTYDEALANHGSALRIAVTHGHLFLPLAEYAPPDVSSRLVLLTLPPRIAGIVGESGDRALAGLAKWAPLQLETFDEFIARDRRFLLYGPPMWVTGELRRAGARLTLLAEEDRDRGSRFRMSTPECVHVYEVSFD
jgi:hypothetical protein